MKKLLLLVSLTVTLAAWSAELLVGPGAGYQTIGEGLKALKPGDTLTIMPGQYYEALELSGFKDNLIRAQFPGSVLIHGDKPAPKFSLLPGYRFIYVADWTENVNALNELDTMKIYLPRATVKELEFKFAGWHLADGKLYISTSDGQAPENHRLTVSVLEGNGLRLGSVENVRIEGLAARGFYSHSKRDTWSGVNGIQLQQPVNCRISNCTAFFNSNGISLSGGSDSVIEGCLAYANGSRNPTSGGNIIGWSGTRNVIRNCRSMFRFPAESSQTIGVRFYGVMLDCLIDNCWSIGEGGLNIKGTVTGCRLQNSYSQFSINASQSHNNIFGGLNGYNKDDISPLKDLKKSEYALHYADPDNHDFRPISAVQIGSWEGISDGASILLPPGEYPPLNISAANVSIKTRGTGPAAVIKGGTCSGPGLVLENLVFSAPVRLESDQAKIQSCVFQDQVSAAGQALQVTHNHFAAKADFSRASGYRHSNIGPGEIQGLTDVGKDFDAFGQGPYRLVREAVPPRITGPFVFALTDQTANIEWWTDAADVSSELSWGESPDQLQPIGQPFSGGYYHSMTLTGLKAGQKYFYQIKSRTPLREHHANMELSIADRDLTRKVISSELLSFTTPTEAHRPQTYTVNPGENISDALDKCRAGDTVLVKGGTYSEPLYFRAGGVTLKAAPGEKVCLDGKRVISIGITLENKPDTVIDGFYFREYNGAAGMIINGGQNITVQRCFYDGRSDGYTPVFIQANSVQNLTVANCVITRGFHGANFSRCPDLLIRNCVWVNNQINHFYIHNLVPEIATIRNNLIADCIPAKIRNPLIGCLNIESIREAQNCYFVRTSEEKRALYSFHRYEGDPVAKQVNYADFLKYTKLPRTSFFANPAFRAFPDLLRFKNPPDVNDASDNRYLEETAEMGKKATEIEHKHVKGKYLPLEFADFFATHPDCRKNDIGLQPEQF